MGVTNKQLTRFKLTGTFTKMDGTTVTYDDEFVSLEDCEDICGVPAGTLAGRVFRYKNKDISELMYPINSQYLGRAENPVQRKYMYDGLEHSCYQLAKISGDSTSYMKTRLERMTVDDAMDPLIPTPDKNGNVRPVKSWGSDIPKDDPDLPLKNRIACYLRDGMTNQQIIERESKNEAMYA